jgi:OFA family oxalate/formate antiporter-like MFS transporter
MSRNTKGWIAVLACSAGIFWSGALVFAFTGIMGEFWRHSFNVGFAETGRIIMFVLLGLASMGYVAGRFHAKQGTKRCFLIGTVLMILGMIVLMAATDIYMIYLWAYLQGLGVMFIYSPGLGTVQQWFPHRRGLVAGMVNLVFGLSGAVMSPVFNAMVLGMNPMNIYIIVAILIAITNIIAAFFCETPGKAKLTYFQRREHDDLLESISAKAAAAGIKVVQAKTAGEAVKTVPFWCLFICWALMGSAGMSMVGVSTAYAASIGLSGAAVLTAFNLTNGFSRIVAGALSDKIGANITGLIAFILAGFGYLGLIFFHSLPAIIVLAMLVGTGFGVLFTISAPMIGGIYGLPNFAAIFGLIFISYGLLGAILGPNLWGVILDATGSFTPVFAYFGAFAFISAILIMFVKPLKQAD